MDLAALGRPILDNPPLGYNLIKLFRLIRVGHLSDMLVERNNFLLAEIYRGVKAIAGLLLSVHWVGCAYIFVAKTEGERMFYLLLILI